MTEVLLGEDYRKVNVELQPYKAGTQLALQGFFIFITIKIMDNQGHHQVATSQADS